MPKNEVFFKNFAEKIGLKIDVLDRVLNVKDYTIKTSFDFKFNHNEITYLIEIDSYNMCKCVLGQYAIINHSKSLYNKDNSIFIVIHFYNNFDKQRTINHLVFAQEQLNCQIPYAVFHIKELERFNKFKFLESINNQINKI